LVITTCHENKWEPMGACRFLVIIITWRHEKSFFPGFRHDRGCNRESCGVTVFVETKKIHYLRVITGGDQESNTLCNGDLLW